MKATGIVRRTDHLGRIVIPKEIRRTLEIVEGDPLEIYTEGEQIVLKKYEPCCVFCGEAKEVVNYKGKNICKNCLEEIATKFVKKKEDDDICKLEESIWKTLK